MEDFAQLFEDDRKGEHAREAEHEKKINELYAEIGQFSTQLSWLKKNLASSLRQSRATGNVGKRQTRNAAENTGKAA